jgi:hypothetical protein
LGAEFDLICHGGAADLRRRLRTLARLLDGDLAGLPPASQLVYLRLVWWAGLGSGYARASLERLAGATGLSRNTVRAALRDLQARGLARPSERRARRATVWWVDLPGWPEPMLPEALPLPSAAPGRWLIDLLEGEDLEAARALLESLPPSERDRLAQEAAARFGDLDPGETEKAVAELVIRGSFGPARLSQYLAGDR